MGWEFDFGPSQLQQETGSRSVVGTKIKEEVSILIKKEKIPGLPSYVC